MAPRTSEHSDARERRADRRRNRPRWNRQVFLNVPFDDIDRYEDCFLAYIAGLAGLALVPRSVLEIPSAGRDRLNRIFHLMRKCRYSVHDLSRIQLRAGRYPRFNMPLELGMATALSISRPAHDRYVFATDFRLVQQVASDLGGIDVYEHRGRPQGVLAALTNAFVHHRHAVRLRELTIIRRALRRWADINCRGTRPRRSVYEPAVFRDMVLFATGLAREVSGEPGPLSR